MKLTFHHAKEKDNSIYFKNLLKKQKIPHELEDCEKELPSLIRKW